VIQGNSNRHPKSLWSDRGTGEVILQFVAEEDRAEAEIVAAEIMKRSDQPVKRWSDYAVLYRSNSQSRVFEETFRRHQIPYKIVGGMSYLDRKEVKDILSYWKIILNPKDDASARRIVNWPPRGIGKGTLDIVHATALEQAIPFLEAIERSIPQMTTKAQESCRKFLHLLADLGRRLDETPPNPESLSQWSKSLLEKVAVKSTLDAESEDPVQFSRRWDTVEDLSHSLGQLRPEEFGGEFEEGAKPVESARDLLSQYVGLLSLEALDENEKQEDALDKKTEEVTFLTLHGSKGLEYPVVFLVGMEDGLLPHQRTIDEATDFSEERRLCYVGITRARDHLILTRAKNRIRYGKPVLRNPSRFLQEIPQELMVIKDESLSPDFASEKARDEHENRIKDHLASIRQSLMGGKPEKPRFR
jgi:superfamily I DNA/RNA helicase